MTDMTGYGYATQVAAARADADYARYEKEAEVDHTLVLLDTDPEARVYYGVSVYALCDTCHNPDEVGGGTRADYYAANEDEAKEWFDEHVSEYA